EGLVPEFDWNAWPLPPVFDWLQREGGISDHELRRTFNCGDGFILVMAASDAEPVLAALLNAGEDAFICGQLVQA
ncbi:MAG: phosphoribosylformylglycinamidine cyclo-ligase, partial [Inquilinus limosus]|nr:phosphoribosylformylglycinamidine cyclo-ligase [Inquilinus limosus]